MKTSTPTGLGIFCSAGRKYIPCSQLYISAASPPVTPLQEEAHGLLLGARLAGLLQLQEVTFFTNCAVLVKAVAFSNVLTSPRHWEIRPQLATICNSVAFNPRKTHHISRSYNFKAHFQARLTVKIQDRALSFRCLANSEMNIACPIGLSECTIG
jgi:hypothetical protein